MTVVGELVSCPPSLIWYTYLGEEIVTVFGDALGIRELKDTFADAHGHVPTSAASKRSLPKEQLKEHHPHGPPIDLGSIAIPLYNLRSFKGTPLDSFTTPTHSVILSYPYK